MPRPYQRKRTQEIQEREARRNRELLVVTSSPEIASPPEPAKSQGTGFEVRLPHTDYTTWPSEEVFRREWPHHCGRLGLTLDDLDSYVQRNKRPVTQTVKK